jgi:N-acetylmuramoyl-L-alanine amidase
MFYYSLDFNFISNGVAGFNSDSINISYIGGIDVKAKAIDNRTPQQKETFKTIYELFKHKLNGVTFHGHNEFSNKACPSYKVKDDLMVWED